MEYLDCGIELDGAICPMDRTEAERRARGTHAEFRIGWRQWQSDEH